MTRIAEIIHGWLGWCPNGQVAKVTRNGDAGPGFYSATPTVKSPGPSGADSSGKPWEGRYEHTQLGTIIIGAVTMAIAVILASMYLFVAVWVTFLVLGIMVFVLAICSTLTVTVQDGALRIRFGPVGLIRKSWPLAEIDTVTTVTNNWYYGWGVRWTPHGRLYNVSGSLAVEVRLFSGTKFRIGTDEPEELSRAILRACAAPSNPSRSK
jgi:hypothetical protein